MKKTTQQILLIGLLTSLIFLSACQKEELQVYKDGRYVQFTTDLNDSIPFSFFFHPGKSEINMALPVKLVGQLAAAEQAYHLEVVAEATTAASQHYALPAQQLFKSNMVHDTAWVTLKKTTDLDNNDVRLVIKITGGKDLKPGQTDCIYKIIRLTSQVSKPIWWDQNMDSYYLGRYSEKKFRTFMNATGIGDLTPYDNNQRLIFFLKFKYYLIEQKEAGNTIYMEDGADMLSTVPLIG